MKMMMMKKKLHSQECQEEVKELKSCCCCCVTCAHLLGMNAPARTGMQPNTMNIIKEEKPAVKGRAFEMRERHTRERKEYLISLYRLTHTSYIP